jgi:hypothetical protein
VIKSLSNPDKTVRRSRILVTSVEEDSMIRSPHRDLHFEGWTTLRKARKGLDPLSNIFSASDNSYHPEDSHVLPAFTGMAPDGVEAS